MFINPVISATATGNYSLRFRSSASAYMSRTSGGSVTSNTVWTYSVWVKKSVIAASNSQYLLNAGTHGGTDQSIIKFNADDTLEVINYVASTVKSRRITTQVFRDPCAWGHLLVASNGATSLKLYWNGVEITSFSTSVGPDATAWTLASASTAIKIGFAISSSVYFDGCLAEQYFIDGQALTPSSFGQTDVSTGQWVPLTYGGSYGTNGWYTPFSNGASTSTLGNDSSGNGNNWTMNNFSVTSGATYDQMNDYPTANYCTLNPLVASASGITDAGLTSSTTVVRGTQNAILFNSYWEVRAGAGAVTAGVISESGTTNTTTVTANKVFGFRLTTAGALDYINITDAGSWTSITTGLTVAQFPYGTTAAANWNFGQQPWVGSLPSTYYALSTSNLPTPATLKPNAHFDVNLRAGNSTDNTVVTMSNMGEVGIAWVKKRSVSVNDHRIANVVRGGNKHIKSNQTDAESSGTTIIKSFSTNTFTLGTDAGVNASGANYVDWAWRANGTGSSNTNGSITSTVSANTTAGISVVTATCTGANGTIGHGLGVAPKLILAKSVNAQNWFVYHSNSNATPQNYGINLNGTGVPGSDVGYWNNTAPTSTVFSVGTNFAANVYIFFCFSEIAGFSKFYTYTGNGSTDGPFVNCGFKPKWIMIRNISNANSWVIEDSARNTYNLANTYLLAESNAIDATGLGIDLVSNGIKVRSTSAGHNTNTDSYIISAFAEFPFKSANSV